MRLALAILLAVLLAAPAQAASPLELAVQDDAVLLWRSYADAGSALDRSREMGAKRVRVNLPWASSMPSDQASATTRPDSIDWDFGLLERLYQDALNRGLLLQVTLTGPAPAWATGDRQISNVRPDPVAFGEFARMAATQFAGRVDRWSVWNEPNWHRRLLPASSAPSRYRSMYKQAFTAIKAADPSTAVLIGELMPGANRKNSTKALRFLRSMTCTKSNWKATKRCGALVADGFALHPYNFARRPKHAKPSDRDIVEIGSLSRLTRALDRLAARGALVTPSRRKMPVYITEFGYFTSGPLRRSPSTHAKWMTEAWRIAERNPRVRQLLQYSIVDPWPDHVTWRSAVLERDGTPRPVFHALSGLASG